VILCSQISSHCNTLQHTATHYHTLPHNATHCNALQRTATHCNTTMQELPKDYWKGKRVLELGAGTGFARCVAVCCSALQ